MSINATGFDEDDEVGFYKLRLFVAGTSPVSVRAINNLQAVLKDKLEGHYELEIVDVHQQPELTENENITAVPMLVKTEPVPKRLLIGDMSETNRIMRAFNLL